MKIMEEDVLKRPKWENVKNLRPTGAKPENSAFWLFGISILLSLCILFFTPGMILGEFYGGVLRDAAPIILIALAVGLTIAAGQIDISTASLAALAATLYACWTQSSGSAAVTYLIFLILLPFLHAAIVGWVIAVRRGPALIVTWALGVIYLFAAGVIAKFVTNSGLDEPLRGNASSVALAIDGTTNWTSINSGGWALLLAICAALGFVLATHVGGVARAIGANKQSTRYIGIQEVRSLFFIFFLVGVFSCLAGYYVAQIQGVANQNAMVGNELVAVAVAVLGGTVMSGGYYSAVGIICAGFVYQIIISLTQSPRIMELVPGLAEAGELEARIVNVLFAFILVGVSALVGRYMSGDTNVVVVKPREGGA